MSKWSGLIMAILFVAGAPVEKADLIAKAGISANELEEALHDLDQEAEDGSGLTIIRLESKLQLATNPIYAKRLQDIFQPHTEGTLSTAVLETLTIIAYQQPVTRARVDQLRGVRSVYAINALLNRGFIEKVGTMDVIGRPALYGTTDTFLRQFGLKSLEDLPPLESVEQMVQDGESSADNPTDSSENKTLTQTGNSSEETVQNAQNAVRDQTGNAQATNSQLSESEEQTVPGAPKAAQTASAGEDTASETADAPHEIGKAPAGPVLNEASHAEKQEDEQDNAVLTHAQRAEDSTLAISDDPQDGDTDDS